MDPNPRAPRPSVVARPAPPNRRRGPGRRSVAVALAVAALALVLTGCVGKRGRNDDPVAPGSEGKPRIELPMPADPPRLTPPRLTPRR